MARIEVIPFNSFMNGSYREKNHFKLPTFDDIIKRLDVKTIVFAGVSILLVPMLTGLEANAASMLLDNQESISTLVSVEPESITASSSLNSSSIDAKGKMLYRKVLNVGKWLIIIKGGWEIIASTVKSDFDKVKKVMVQYLIAYGCLWLFPFVLDEIENFFNTM